LFLPDKKTFPSLGRFFYWENSVWNCLRLKKIRIREAGDKCRMRTITNGKDTYKYLIKVDFKGILLLVCYGRRITENTGASPTPVA
jgi:hypothetical protein